MILLIIEDEEQFREKVRSAAAAADYEVQVLFPDDVALLKEFDVDTPIELQLQKRFTEILAEREIDLVLLDYDLSRFKERISQSACLIALQAAGIPVCRYSKKHSQSKLGVLQALVGLAQDGARSIATPEDLLQGDAALISWLQKISDGFRQIETVLINLEPIARQRGPLALMTTLLGNPDLRTDLLGYTSQNLNFFATSIAANDATPESVLKKWSTQLGYWLYNYILAFPGPILPFAAAAAYLNLTLDAMHREEVQTVIASAKYEGPFSLLSDRMYWTHKLEGLIEEWGGDICKSKALSALELSRVDATRPTESVNYCVITSLPIPSGIASYKPDWIPPGAQIARVRADEYEKLGPMLNL